MFGGKGKSMPKYKFAREDVVSAEELAETLTKTRKLWLKALISFCYIFGPRIMEALKLKKQDFQIDGKRLSVKIGVLKRRQKGPFKDMPHVLHADLNTPFLEHVVAWLKKVEHPDDFLWPLAHSWSRARVRAWEEMKKLNPTLTPHVLRHSRLTKLALRGADGPALMDWAGWADMRPAPRYLHISGRLAEKYADKID